MPSLLNQIPIPANIRRCFWDAAYIASQPFCITSKLTDEEAKQLAEFEEQKMWERNEQLRTELGYSQVDLEQIIDELKQETTRERIFKSALLEVQKSHESSLDSITSKLEEDFFLKHAKNINKSDYLTR